MSVIRSCPIRLDADGKYVPEHRNGNFDLKFLNRYAKYDREREEKSDKWQRELVRRTSPVIISEKEWLRIPEYQTTRPTGVFYHKVWRCYETVCVNANKNEGTYIYD